MQDVDDDTVKDGCYRRCQGMAEVGLWFGVVKKLIPLRVKNFAEFLLPHFFSIHLKRLKNQ